MRKTPGGHHPLVHPRVIRWLREEWEAVPPDRRATRLREEILGRGQESQSRGLPLGESGGAGNRKAEPIRLCPSVIHPPRRSGCSPAGPYPPGGQAEYTMTP